MRAITHNEITRGLKEIRKKYQGKFPLGIVDKPSRDYVQIEIAYNWLDAQKFVDKFTARYDLKEKVSHWSGKHISHFSILVAAHIHPDIEGEYPSLNLGVNSRIPRHHRLENILSADKSRKEQARSIAKKKGKESGYLKGADK